MSLLAALLLAAGLVPYSATGRDDPGLGEPQSASIEARGAGDAFHAQNALKAQPPTVAGITPDSGANNGIVQITDLSGSNFQPGAAVKLAKTGELGIPGTGISVVSTSTIACTFDLREAVTGTWDVVVTNPDAASGVLDGGFTVRSPSYIYFPLVASNWPINITVYRSADSWAEGTVNWNSQPDHSEAYGSAQVTDFYGGWYLFDVTELVDGWVNGRFPNYGLMVRGPESSGRTSVRLEFASREYSGTLFDPRLEITYADGNVTAPELTTATAGTPVTEARGTVSDLPALHPTGDAMVLDGYPSLALGSASFLWVGYDRCLEPPPPGQTARSLLKFDIPEIPWGTPIFEATLHLYLLGTCGVTLSAQKHPLDHLPGISDLGDVRTVEQLIRESH